MAVVHQAHVTRVMMTKRAMCGDQCTMDTTRKKVTAQMYVGMDDPYAHTPGNV